MSLYNGYDAFYRDHPRPEKLGGMNRAVKAIRDKFGRFMPDSEMERILWELPEIHGREGGAALVAKRGKDWMKEIGKRGAEARNKANKKARKED